MAKETLGSNKYPLNDIVCGHSLLSSGGSTSFMPDETPEPRSGFKTALVFSMLFAVLGAVVVFAYLATFRRPVTTVILVRHAEKIIAPNNSHPSLTPPGPALPHLI